MGSRGRQITDTDWSARSKLEQDGGTGRWWTAPPEDVAGRVNSLAAQIENGNWTSNYYVQYVCQRYLTGRSTPAGFGYSMVRRAGRTAQSMASATWSPPTINLIAQAADVFSNKVFKNHPWITYLPAYRGSYKLRSRCRDLTAFIDAAMKELDVFAKAEMCGLDAMTYPSAFMKIGSGTDGRLKIDRVLSSEILITPEQAGSFVPPRSCLQRVFISKSDLVAAFAKGDSPEDIATRQAIRNAPGVYPGYYTSNNTDYNEIAALIEGWSLPLADGTPGRHVLVCGDCVLFDKPWKRKRLPFAKLDFQRLSNEYMGQSLAEIGLPLQRYIDRLSTAIDEIEQRWSFPRYFVETSSHVDTDQFGADFVEYAGTAPQKDSSNSVPSELYTSRDKAMELFFLRFGISQAVAAGSKPEGLSSGLAIAAWSQIDDARHVDLAQRYEQFFADIAELIIDECEEIRPSFIVEGNRKLKWDDVEMATDKYRVQPFPMSRLPQSPAVRFEMIARWYQEGTISRAEKMRLENMPDTQRVVDAHTASADWVENALDEIIETGRYRPPLPYLDLQSARFTAQARFVREDLLGLENDRLRLINRFIVALREMTPPATAAGPQMSPMGAGSQQNTAGPSAETTGSPQVGQG